MKKQTDILKDLNTFLSLMKKIGIETKKKKRVPLN